MFKEFVISRIVRLVRILRFLPDFTVMIKSFRDTLPVLWQYLLVLVSAIYGFAIIGMELFAGKLTCGDTLDESISYCELNFRKLNFDSLVRCQAGYIPFEMMSSGKHLRSFLLIFAGSCCGHIIPSNGSKRFPCSHGRSSGSNKQRGTIVLHYICIV